MRCLFDSTGPIFNLKFFPLYGVAPWNMCARRTIDHVWISITPKGGGSPRNILQVLYSAMTSMRGWHKTPDALHRFWVESPWKRRAVYVRAHYKGEHVWLSIAPKRKARPAIFLQSLYTPTSSIRRFRDNPDALHHFRVGSPRKREIQQKSHFRPSLEGPKFFEGRNSKVALYRFVRRSSLYACAEKQARTTRHESMRSFHRKRIKQKCQNFPIFRITPWRPRASESIVTWQFVSTTDCALRVKIWARYLEGLRKYLRGSEKTKMATVATNSFNL